MKRFAPQNADMNTKGITKPIISLRDAAREIGKGKLDTKIEIKSKDEIGELASSLNQMTVDLLVPE